jgi:hypothetical protein
VKYLALKPEMKAYDTNLSIRIEVNEVFSFMKMRLREVWRCRAQKWQKKKRRNK